MERPVFPEEHVEVEEELVGQVAERGAETTPGPEIQIAPPWEGYDRMKAGEIRERLEAADTAAAGMVEIYERAKKNRKSVIDAAERAQRR
jgi:cytosine/adenosine deaminase-related metal-dependent hydrolase